MNVSEYIAQMIALTVSLPLLCFFVLFLVLAVMMNDRKRALLMAADAAVLFFAISIYFKLLAIFDSPFYSSLFIICFFIMFAGLLILIRTQSAISATKAFKKCWRFSFLVLLPLSTFLTIYGILTGILENL
ncbi:DUF3397 family protein [Metabacillus idriensis]|uniref:DUF3397 family protein n=1 Tax=Metabacillus idriensis TaxID=324768 RepID=UPI00174C4427|nr:DUF3397 family protein [Metabacillus idriensis]